MSPHVDLEKLQDIQIEWKGDCEKLHINNNADFATQRTRLKDFLRECEAYFISNFGSILLLIGWVHVQFSIHFIGRVKVGPVCVVGKKCTGKTKLLEAIGCLLPLLISRVPGLAEKQSG